MIALDMFPIIWLAIASAWAHPFGSNLYGHKTDVRVYGDRVEVDYLAEIPTPVLLRELKSYMADIESPVQADQDRHTEQMRTELADGLRLLADGERLPWSRRDCSQTSGHGDSRFIAYHVCVSAELTEGTRTLNLINGNRPDETALFSTEVLVGPAIVLDASSQIDVDHHGQIVADRSGTWRGDERDRELRLSFRVRSDVGAAFQRGIQRPSDTDLVHSNRSLSSAEPDPLLSLVKGDLTPKGVWLALMMALVLGAAHAFSPGHGKALVAAYLLGERKKVRHAVALGGIVTVTHTITVFALGGVALLLSEVMPPEHLLPWMELASGLLVLGVGIHLFRQRVLPLRRENTHEHHEHEHHRDHSHDHSHEHSHDHHGMDEAAHAALHAEEMAKVSTPRDVIAMGISGGLAPCPSALVLLLTAISFHRVAFGLVLVAVFSFGLAFVVTAVGVTVVMVGDRLRDRVSSGVFTRTLPAFSAIVITTLGLGLTLAGLDAVRTLWGSGV